MAERELSSLGVDLGNSSIKVYHLPLLESPSPQTHGQDQAEAWLAWCPGAALRFEYDAIPELCSYLQQAMQIDLISVSPQNSNEILAALEKDHADVDLRVWTSALVPLAHPYERPELLGTDRLVAALAAKAMFPDQPLVVVDLGSAITVDLVTAAGVFAGGAIAPGLAVLNESLAKMGAQLWEVDLAAASGVAYPAENSADAMALGLSASFCGSVLELIRRALDSMSASDVADHRLVLGGGDAERIQGFLQARGMSPVLVPNLLQIGLAQLSRLKLPIADDMSDEVE